jgi:DNA primase
MIETQQPFVDPAHAAIVAHWTRVAPLLERTLGSIPLWWALWPNGFDNQPIYHKHLDGAPHTIPTVAVTTASGTHPYLACSTYGIDWLVRARYAVALYSWVPRATAFDRAAFARLSLEASGGANRAHLLEAASHVFARLERLGLSSFGIADGVRGFTIWIPFADAPDYRSLREWLGSFAATLVSEMPSLYTVEALRADRGDRIYLGTRSNAPGNGTLLPFSPIGTDDLALATPFAPSDLASLDARRLTIDVFESNADTVVAAFDDLVADMHPQNLSDLEPHPAVLVEGPPALDLADLEVEESPPPHDARGYMISAALTVLADGKAHSAEDILEQGKKAGLIPSSTTAKYVYTALREYMLRALGAHRVPELIQIDGTRMFRLNRPADDWPAIELPPAPHWLSEAQITSTIERLRATSVGADPTAFEIAVCDALTSLGLIATHVGGNGEPDGIATAALGIAGYKLIVECKTAEPGSNVSNPRPEEPAKFRDAYGATLAMLVGPQFGNDASLENELAAHAVSLWTVDDLARALRENIGPSELRSALVPGRATPALDAILWERLHGRRKRVAVIADRLHRSAWRTQTAIAGGVPLTQAPALLEETLFVLVDDALVAEGLINGAPREEFEAAFALAVANGRLVSDGQHGYVAAFPYIAGL